MPIRYTDDPASAASVAAPSEQFIVFWSSRDEHGKLWCPDCVAVEDLTLRTFEGADKPSALIVWVGQRAEWKSPSNAFRGDPWKVKSIPTVIRTRDGARLEESEILQGLASLVEAP